MNAGTSLLAAVRQALRPPFADPVTVRGVAVSRAEARAMERGLWRGGARTTECSEGKGECPPAGAAHPGLDPGEANSAEDASAEAFA